MKCIPITDAGRFVAEAIFVIEMEEVFVARMQCCGGRLIYLFKYFQLQ